jgi:hypothetical protein
MHYNDWWNKYTFEAVLVNEFIEKHVCLFHKNPTCIERRILFSVVCEVVLFA